MFGVACLLGPHGPRGLDTVCWAAATPAGYNRGSLEGAEGAEGTTGQLEVCVPLFQTNESLLRGFFFFQGSRRDPRMDLTKHHAKALFKLIFLCFSQIVFFSLHKPVFLELIDMMGCAWRTSAASLEADCQYNSLTAGPTL